MAEILTGSRNIVDNVPLTHASLSMRIIRGWSVINSCQGNTRLLAICDLQLNLIKVHEITRLSYYRAPAAAVEMEPLQSVLATSFFISHTFNTHTNTLIYIHTHTYTADWKANCPLYNPQLFNLPLIWKGEKNPLFLNVSHIINFIYFKLFDNGW